jgi:hypothetical protein
LRLNGVPDTIEKGALTDTAPDTVPPLVFETVNILSTKLPTATLPKLTEPVGLTENSARARAFATLEHELSFPVESTAVTAT